MVQPYLGFFFEQNNRAGNKGILSESLEGVDRAELNDAVDAFLSTEG